MWFSARHATGGGGTCGSQSDMPLEVTTPVVLSPTCHWRWKYLWFLVRHATGRTDVLDLRHEVAGLCMLLTQMRNRPARGELWLSLTSDDVSMPRTAWTSLLTAVVITVAVLGSSNCPQ